MPYYVRYHQSHLGLRVTTDLSPILFRCYFVE